MSKSLTEVAQMCMDAFYQEYKPSDAFLDMVHFKFMCMAADSYLKLLEYKEQENKKLRLRLVNMSIRLSEDNFLVERDVKVDKNNVAKLKNKIMSFPGDLSNLGVASVEPNGNSGCSNLMRTTVTEKWMIKGVKDVIFWYPIGNEINLVNNGIPCEIKSLDITYIPVASDDTIINQSRVWNIMQIVSKYIVDMKNGNVVDMSNDGNPNTNLQTEISKYLIKSLQR